MPKSPALTWARVEVAAAVLAAVALILAGSWLASRKPRPRTQPIGATMHSLNQSASAAADNSRVPQPTLDPEMARRAAA
jgi:hypothetical protein